MVDGSHQLCWHQSLIRNMWRMCVSFRSLNRITNPFEFPIRRCDSTIEDVGDGSGYIYFVSLDAAQGYHQRLVRRADRSKLAFLPQTIKSMHIESCRLVLVTHRRIIPQLRGSSKTKQQHFFGSYATASKLI